MFMVHLDITDCQRGVEDGKGEECSKVLRHQDGVEAHHRDTCCTTPHLDISKVT